MLPGRRSEARPPGSKGAGATALAALLQVAPPAPFEMDGHESSRHYPAVLATVPNFMPVN